METASEDLTTRTSSSTKILENFLFEIVRAQQQYHMSTSNMRNNYLESLINILKRENPGAKWYKWWILLIFFSINNVRASIFLLIKGKAFLLKQPNVKQTAFSGIAGILNIAFSLPNPFYAL